MMWFAASLPFWLLGGLLTIGGIAAPLDQRPGETARDLVAQCFFGLSAAAWS
jgi:hypothetical protein